MGYLYLFMGLNFRYSFGRDRKQVATVMVASTRIAAAAQLDRLYSPGGTNVEPRPIRGVLGPWAA